MDIISREESAVIGREQPHVAAFDRSWPFEMLKSALEKNSVLKSFKFLEPKSSQHSQHL